MALFIRRIFEVLQKEVLSPEGITKRNKITKHSPWKTSKSTKPKAKHEINRKWLL